MPPRNIIELLSVLMLGLFITGSLINAQTELPYPIVDTDQTYCFSDMDVIACGEAFNGQDAQYGGRQPAYQDNGDGTITDRNTGLMWIRDPGAKTSYADALETLASYRFAGYDDWRLPTIKELYSLTSFSGIDPSGLDGSADNLRPFINDDVFVFQYGDETTGSRLIDSQWLTSTVYNASVMNGQRCFFGFNFADGRIKCYPIEVRQGGSGGYFALFVRGNEAYGVNDFVDNGDGTITDRATGLTWMQDDSGRGMQWGEALDYCETLEFGGANDWRLPDVKVLQSIVSYDRSPDVTNSPAIDPIFNVSQITNEAGQTDYPFYWSSTTHMNYGVVGGSAAYISFGRALGYMEEFGGWVDVHGAGAQRSDPKTGNPDEYPIYFGPQGDVSRLLNYARCVRGGAVQPANGDDPATFELLNVGDNLSSQEQTQGNPPGSPDFAVAAQKLGITEQVLRDALGTQRPPDLQAAASRLGVTVQQLEDALGVPPR